MSIKVSNDRLELKINPFNNPDYIATFVDNKTIDYISQDSLSSLMNLREYINGLTLKNYGNRLIINEGSFFDTEDNKLYVFNKPTTKTLKFADESEINTFYNHLKLKEYGSSNHRKKNLFVCLRTVYRVRQTDR